MTARFSVDEGVLDRLFDRLEIAEGRALVNGWPCLEWTGYTTALGYGQLRVGRKVVLVHRLMWELCNHQRIPCYGVILHVCDNPRCCEPTHLRLGTHEDNVEDRVNKGRSACGERHGRAKLNADAAAAIRRRRGEPISGLAREFGVAPRAIAKVLAGETWKTVG